MMENPKRVLLIEDNPENRYLATLLLQDEGYAVCATANGEEGIALAAKEAFAFVLLDLQLPDIDGFEVARRLRELAPATELPIIAVSAFAMSSELKRAQEAGCSGYIEKPIDAAHFMAQVHCLAGVTSL